MSDFDDIMGDFDDNDEMRLTPDLWNNNDETPHSKERTISYQDLIASAALHMTIIPSDWFLMLQNNTSKCWGALAMILDPKAKNSIKIIDSIRDTLYKLIAKLNEERDKLSKVNESDQIDINQEFEIQTPKLELEGLNDESKPEDGEEKPEGNTNTEE